MIAFYAPLKSPEHPVPSGDRTMARALLSALPEARLVSSLRLYDGAGDAQVQAGLEQAAQAEAARLLAEPEAAQWRAWLTYHNYYKAPDLIGPAVSAALDIPYVQIESTRARKRLQGPWARFAAQADASCDAAAAILYLTARDAEALRAYAPAGQRIVPLPPFLDQDTLPDAAACDGPMLSVGMLRPGDKLASYGVIAEVLALLRHPDWHLRIIGGGAAQHEVEALMAPFAPQVTFTGALPPGALAPEYARAALLLWPGVNEAFGLTYLEAQAHGLPVVAQDRPGVRDVVSGAHPDPALGAAPLAARVDALLADAAERRAAGAAGRAKVAAKHLRPAARDALSRVLAQVGA